MMKVKYILFFFSLIIMMGCSLFVVQEDVDFEKISFNEFIDYLEKTDLKQRSKKIHKFFEKIVERTSFPIIEDNEVTFVYKSDSDNINKSKEVFLIGEIAFSQENGYKMDRIDGTNIFYKKMKLAKDTRVKYEYKDDNIWKLDKWNSLIETETSLLIMPEYNHPEAEYDDSIPHGKIEVKYLEEDSIFNRYNKKRKIQIYLPPNYSKENSYKTIYFNDGSNYIERSKIPNVLDYMIHNKEIEPVVAVFIDYIYERETEYLYKTQSVYADYLVNHIMPILEKEYSLIQNREGRVLVGFSNSAGFVLYAGDSYYDKFKYFFIQSGAPSYLGDNSAFIKNYKTKELPIKIYSAVGEYEYEVGKKSIVQFHKDLKSNPYILDEKLVFYNQGHTMRQAGDSFREGLMWLFKE